MKSPHLFLIYLAAGWFVYCLVKVFSPTIVFGLFSAENFGLLNSLAAVAERQTLDFYQGRIQETVFGPFNQVLSFFLLASMILKYFREVSGWVYFWLIFGFLLITKTEVLLYPPYGDAIGGPFAEALWLYQNSFDYRGLFHQSNFDVGGPRVYFFSLYPGFLAVTMKVIPSTELFLFAHHVAAFAFTAGIIAFFRECCRKVFEPVTAIWSSLVLLALPLYQSQSEAINMEIPVAFFTIGAAYFLSVRRWGQGALWACLAAMVKGIGIIACFGAFVILIYAALKTRALKEKFKLIGISLLPSATAIFLVCAKFIFKDTHVQVGLVRWEAGWPSLRKEFIFYLFITVLLISIAAWGWRKWKTRTRIHVSSEKLLPVIMFLFASAWFLLFLNFYAVSPRYRVALYPFLVFVVFYGFAQIFPCKILQRSLTAGVLFAACLASYGVLYGSPSVNDHVLLERSLEYRNDLLVNRRLAMVAEERYSHQLIVAPFVIAQALAIPKFGYVKKKLNIMIYGYSLKYGGILNYPGLRNLDPQKTVFIGVRTAPIDQGFDYPINPRDVILETISVGNKNASFFLGGLSVEALWRVRRGLI